MREGIKKSMVFLCVLLNKYDLDKRRRGEIILR